MPRLIPASRRSPGGSRPAASAAHSATPPGTALAPGRRRSRPPLPPSRDRTGFGVPAFAHPLVAPAEWAELARPGAPLHWTAFDVHRGPGTRPDPVYADALARIRENRVPVLGLLDCAHGTRPFGALVTEASHYLDWYRVDGFYLDRAPTLRSELAECCRVVCTLRAMLDRERAREQRTARPDPSLPDADPSAANPSDANRSAAGRSDAGRSDAGPSDAGLSHAGASDAEAGAGTCAETEAESEAETGARTGAAAAPAARGPIVLAPGAYPHPGYAEAADQLVVFDGPWTRYRWSEAPQWSAAYPPSRFAHLVHGLPVTHLDTALRIARWQGAATLCLTDRTDRDGADPWAGLADYWHEAVRRVTR